MRLVAALAAQCLTATVVSSEAVVETCEGAEGLLESLRRLRGELSFLFALRALPLKVASFQWRAHRLARRLGDEFSLKSATRPRDLAKLIELARSRECVVELGTGTAWTAISLALADRGREVVSYDPIERRERELYARLVGLSVRDRVELVAALGADGAESHRTVDLVYVDSSHGREETIREVQAWQPVLTEGAPLVFDDFTHPLYPGVHEAVARLGLDGEQHGSLFVHRIAGSASRKSSGPTPPMAVRGFVWAARRLPGRLVYATRLARQALQERRIAAEQRRGAMGPAHLGWRGHSSAENRRRWSDYDWSKQGEEWSASPEWKQSLVEDVLERWIPVGAVTLEIGPGAGRWSEALAMRALHLVLVDVSERSLELCRERFGDEGRVAYIRSYGNDLPGVPDDSIDAVWSFDVFVHMAPSDQAAYLGEIARVLVPGGVAVIHHSDGRDRGELPSRHGWRSPMSRALFAAMAIRCGLRVESQFDSWGPEGRYDLSSYGDAITVCRG